MGRGKVPADRRHRADARVLIAEAGMNVHAADQESVHLPWPVAEKNPASLVDVAGHLHIVTLKITRAGW